MKDDKDISVTRAVGRFLGHIWGAASKPVPEENQTQSQVVDHRVEEAQGMIGDKKIVLRRTTIEEVEIREE